MDRRGIKTVPPITSTNNNGQQQVTSSAQNCQFRKWKDDRLLVLQLIHMISMTTNNIRSNRKYSHQWAT